MIQFFKTTAGVNIALNIIYTLILTVWDMIAFRNLSMHEREFAKSLVFLAIPLIFLQFFVNLMITFYYSRTKKEKCLRQFLTTLGVFFAGIVIFCIGIVIARTLNQNDI